MAPPQGAKESSNFLSSTNANSLKTAIFHTMAFKMSLEINNNKITIPTARSFLKVLYIICQMKKKNISFEQFAKPHRTSFFVLNSSCTTKYHYLCVEIDEVCETFKKMLLDFGYTQKWELYDPQTHQVHPPQSHAFY